jgi:hypothetical protein
MLDMRSIVIALLVGVCLAPVLRAQEKPEVACYANREDNRPYKKKLWEGYEISLGPSRKVTDGDNCTAAIYNAHGKVVFRTTGFNVIFDQKETGEDFDGDGKPDVVFQTDTGGGNHCCWAYNVVALSPQPHKLFDVAQAAAFKKVNGRMVIWQREAGPFGYTSMARNPYAEKVFHVENGKLVDVTPTYCAAIFSGKSSESSDDYQEWQSVLTPENLKQLQSHKEEDPQKIAWAASTDNEEIVSALLSRALQHVFCHEYDKAMSDLDLWPEASRAKMKADFAEWAKTDYPEFWAKLLPAAGSK